MNIRNAVLLLLVSLTSSCGPPALPQAPRGEPLTGRLTLEATASRGVSPWSEWRIALRDVNGRLMLVQEASLHGGFQDVTETSLVTEDVVAELNTLLGGCELAQLGNGQEVTAVSRWTWQIAWEWTTEQKVRAGRFTVAAPDLQPDARYEQCLDGLIHIVERETRRLPFELVFVAESDRGWADITSDPPATLFIDGVRWGETPRYRLPLPAGTHTIRLVTPDADESWELGIEVGVTTRFDVDL